MFLLGAAKNHPIVSRFAAALVVSIGITLYLAFSINAERLPIKTYTVADGLLRDNVYRIKQDSRGFLWFCTVEGISRYDGYEFINFTTADGLPDRHVNDFLETKDGTILLATGKGLVRLNPTGRRGPTRDQVPPLFTTILTSNPKAAEISVLFADTRGQVFAGTEDGLYKLSDRFELEAVPLGQLASETKTLSITSIMEDRQGSLWIGTQGSGLVRLWSNNQVELFGAEDGLPVASISALMQDREGRVWVGFRPNARYAGLCKLVMEPIKGQPIVDRYYQQKDGLPSDWITDLFQSSDGKFWVGTIRGLCLWQGGESSVCKTFTEAHNLCDEEVWSITEDKDNNLWTGTRCGAKKWARYGFTSFYEADGTGNTRTNSIFENSTGELFASFIKNGVRSVSRFDGERFELVQPKFPPSILYAGWGWKQTVWQDSVGDWWFPLGAGPYRFKKPARFADLARLSPQKLDMGVDGSEVFRLFEDSRGDLWVGTTGTVNALLRWDRATNTWYNLSEKVGFDGNRLAVSFVEDKDGNLWIGTGWANTDDGKSALIRYRDGQFRIFTEADGLPTGWCRDLFFDHLGRLWIANPTHGLLRLDQLNSAPLNFTRYTPADGLSSVAVTSVTEDAFGRIYVGTGRGLDRLNPETGQVENFTTADGLPNSNVEVAYRDRHNELWFGTVNGLARFVPEPERRRQPPKVLITGLRVSGVPQAFSILGETQVARLDLSSDQRQVTVDFVGLGASLGEPLKYEYRLGSAEWTATKERTVNFANLSAGEYRLEVRVRTADGILSELPATVSFRIAAPVWQRWWFLLMVALTLAAIIYYFYRFRLQRLLELEKVRTRIATDLHDDIGANLTRISLLSEVARQRSENGSGQLMSSIADIARESVASMNDIVWAISPDHDSLLDLTRRMRQHAEEVFTQRDIDLVFEAPASTAELKLSVGVRRDLLLLFKEAVNNAAKHSGCSRVAIQFHCDHSILRLRISDNGQGFAADQSSDGQGLRSMTRRAKTLGGKLTIDSRDGTTIELEMSRADTRT
ncbi:MAG: two-component regulator propeller domain-containing protein [Pyrinomonadaceae bacterium]